VKRKTYNLDKGRVKVGLNINKRKPKVRNFLVKPQKVNKKCEDGY
jgi:hypothetical protein